MQSLAHCSEFVFPAYDGGSIANIVPTVARLLDVPFDGLPPLRDSLWQPLAGDVRRVVVLLVDAMGWSFLNQARDHLADLLDAAVVDAPITSVFPSTTVNCLSSVVTGSAPAQHGLVGLRLFFPEYAVLGEMLGLGPEFRRMPDALVQAGLDPEAFLARPGGAAQLSAHGVRSYAWKGVEIVHSALSRMHGHGLHDSFGVLSFTDMLVQMRELLVANRRDKLYLYGYWPTVDGLAHYRGPQSAHVTDEVVMLLREVKRVLLDGLPREARRGTALFIVADHGQVTAPPAQHVLAADQRALTEMLLMRSAGEPRVPYFYARHGRTDAVRDYINAAWEGLGVAVSAESALQSGLLGPPPWAPQTLARLGDVIAVMRHGALYLNPDEEEKARNVFIGRHGSLHRDEMVVPWLGFRL